MLVALAAAALVPAAASTVMRLVPPADDPTALVASFIAYGLIGYLIALCCLVVVLLRARRRAVPAALCTFLVALIVLHASWLAPFFVPDQRPVTSRPFTLMSLNLHAGQAASQQVAEQAQQADIVILVEVTPASLRTLESSGLGSPLSVRGRRFCRRRQRLGDLLPLPTGNRDLDRHHLPPMADDGHRAGDRHGDAGRCASVQSLLRQQSVGERTCRADTDRRCAPVGSVDHGRRLQRRR